MLRSTLCTGESLPTGHSKETVCQPCHQKLTMLATARPIPLDFRPSKAVNTSFLNDTVLSSGSDTDSFDESPALGAPPLALLKARPELVLFLDKFWAVSSAPFSGVFSPAAVQALGWDASEFPPNVRVEEDKGALRYVGPVGTNSARSVRALDALPKPSWNTVTTKILPAPPKKKSLFRKKQPLPTILKHTTVFEPFTDPFLLANGEECTMERMVSYFEVNLLSWEETTVGVEAGEQSDPDDEQVPLIAIGLTLHSFDWENALPGWGSQSYGYHGDTGATMRNDKKKIDYGPSFGAGDVVGCGIDYDTRCIFFTLNSKFLGNAFVLTSDQLKNGSWIPTVGLDSHVAVQYNVQGPFTFDLRQYCEDEPPVAKEAVEEGKETSVETEEASVNSKTLALQAGDVSVAVPDEGVAVVEETPVFAEEISAIAEEVSVMEI